MRESENGKEKGRPVCALKPRHALLTDLLELLSVRLTGTRRPVGRRGGGVLSLHLDSEEE